MGLFEERVSLRSVRQPFKNGTLGLGRDVERGEEGWISPFPSLNILERIDRRGSLHNKYEVDYYVFWGSLSRKQQLSFWKKTLGQNRLASGGKRCDQLIICVNEVA